MDITLTFDHNINESLQCAPWPNGDNVYYCHTQSHGGFDTVDNENLPSTGIVYMGKCTSFGDNNSITIRVDPGLSGGMQNAISSGLGFGDFIMFSKSNEANLNSLLGYYAETTFINDSPHEAELFATSTEFSESSK